MTDVENAMGLAAAQLASKASAKMVAEFAERARMVLRLDSYGLSMAIMFAQVRSVWRPRGPACAQLRPCHSPLG